MTRVLQTAAGEVRVYPDAPSVAAAAAEEWVRHARASHFRVALAGGSTPRACYLLLANERRADVDWARVEIFFGDERCVPPDHADSNYGMARRALLDHVPIPPTQLHRMRGEDEPVAAARAYEDVMRQTLGTEPLDLVLLGMGPDGHTASLFPGTTALDETQAWVVANRVPQLGVDRLTLTFPVLSAARAVVVNVTGAEKAARLVEVLRGGNLPINHVRPTGGCLWLIDEAAAMSLT